MFAIFLSIPNVSATAAEETEEKNYNLHVTIERNYDYAKEVFELVNQERRKAGVPEVQLDEELTESAMVRAKELSYVYEHRRPNHTAINTAFTAIAFENAGLARNTSKQVMADWMKSEGHKTNILNENWTSVGIGCIKYKDTYCWIQLFSRKFPEGTVSSGAITSVEDIEISSYFLNLTAAEFPEHMSVGERVPFVLSQPNIYWEYLIFVPDADSFDYASSNNNVASIDSNGYVTACSSGTTIITAYYAGTSDIAYSTCLTCTEKQNATVTSAPTTSHSSTPTPSVTTSKININRCSVQTKKIFTFSGTAIQPAVSITYNGKYLVKNTDYTISYKGNLKPGTGMIMIHGIGRFSGKTNLAFTIVPKKYKVVFRKRNGRKKIIQSVEWNKSAKKIKMPHKKGYVFAGWYTANGKKYKFSSKVKKNLILYAKWRKK